jgi:hypothetical protein
MRATLSSRRMRTGRRLTGIGAASLLAVSLLGGGNALASTPGWTVGHGTDSSNVYASTLVSGASSSAVSAGNSVGFFEWLRNGGTSNISQLYLTATTSPSAPVVGAVWTIKTDSMAVVRSGACPTTTPLDCSFGALNPGETVYVTAAFTTGHGTSQTVSFDWNSNGNTLSDKHHTSHGDSIPLPDSVALTSNGDAAGDFNFDQSAITVADDQKVGPKNPQATTASAGGALTGLAVADGASLSTPCDAALTAAYPTFSCSQLTSLTSTIEAGRGRTIVDANGHPLIKVIVTFAKAPSKLGGAHPFVYHFYLDNLGNQKAEVITTTCTYVAGLLTNTDSCFTVGQNQVTVWLVHNGNMRI